MEQHFYLKEQLTDKLWLFRLWYLIGTFLEVKEIILSLQRKQLTLFCQWWNLNFQAKVKILKIVSAAANLTASQYLKNFSDEFSNGINKCIFLCCIMKCADGGKISITQWSLIFQLTNLWWLKKKSHRSEYPFHVQDRAIDFKCHRVSNVYWFDFRWHCCN